MKPDQITALAREYAEETRNGILGLFPQPLPDSMEVLIKNDQEYYWRFLRWLTRRYCLVEKENIEKYFQSRNYILTHQDEYAVYIVRESEVEMKLLRCIFPEIAKEVK